LLKLFILDANDSITRGFITWSTSFFRCEKILHFVQNDNVDRWRELVVSVLDSACLCPQAGSNLKQKIKIFSVELVLDTIPIFIGITRTDIVIFSLNLNR